jgi:prepilin-type N-terminal cleavage/methylation domain-containing protein
MGGADYPATRLEAWRGASPYPPRRMAATLTPSAVRAAGAQTRPAMGRWTEDSGRKTRRREPGGFTLVELCIAMVIICLMVTLAVPTFRRSIEQARADVASANLRTLWSAQRIYWLENRRFASSLSDLRALDLVDVAIADSASNPAAVYVYSISGADASTFTAGALRNASGVWAGQIQINQQGTLSGVIVSTRGDVVTPTQ